MMLLIYLLIFVSFWDLFVQLPITSTYAKTLGAATGFIGFIAGAYSFSNLFSNVFSGYLVDKTGPKKVLSIGFLVNGLVFSVILYCRLHCKCLLSASSMGSLPVF